jgi:hypothetical protein
MTSRNKSTKIEWAVIRNDELVYMYHPFDPLYNCFVGHWDSPSDAMAAMKEAGGMGMSQYCE